MFQLPSSPAHKALVSYLNHFCAETLHHPPAKRMTAPMINTTKFITHFIPQQIHTQTVRISRLHKVTMKIGQRTSQVPRRHGGEAENDGNKKDPQNSNSVRRNWQK